MMKEGISSNSISATSGAPDPAFMALFSRVYSAPPAPGSSSVTQIDGWVLLNSVTARLIPGTQAQNMTGVDDELQDFPPASTVADALALALALVLALVPLAAVLDDPLLLHAASSEMAAAPATPAVILRVFDNIMARLLSSVLPCCVRLPRPPVVRRWPRWPPGCYLLVIAASMTVNDRGGSRMATTPSLVFSDPSSSCAVSTSGSVRASRVLAAVTVRILAGPSKV